MPLPSTGELKLWDDLWNSELAGSQGNNSLHSASIYAGFSTPDALSDFYGWSDVEVPTVSTNAMSNVNYNRMCANGNVGSTGNENPDSGFYFGRSAQRTSNTKYSIGTGGAGGFLKCFGGLPQLSTHYGWAYACNSAGEAVGTRAQAATTEQSFTITQQNYTEGFFDIWGETYIVPYSNHANLSWINPYSGNVNSIHQCSTQNGRISNYNGTVVANADNRFRLCSNTTLEFWGDAGGQVKYPSYFTLGQFSMQTGDITKTASWSGASGVQSRGGYTYTNYGHEGGNTRFLWTHSVCTAPNYPSPSTSQIHSDIRLKTNIKYL